MSDSDDGGNRAATARSPHHGSCGEDDVEDHAVYHDWTKDTPYIYEHKSLPPLNKPHTLITLPVTLRQLEAEHTPNMSPDWMKVIPMLRRHRGHVIIQTSDEQVVCYKIKGYFRGADALNEHCQRAEEGWCLDGGQLPQEKTKRYDSEETVDKSKSGTFHYAFGKEKYRWFEKPLVSSHALGGTARKFNVAQTFLQGLVPLQNVASELAERLFPDLHDEYRQCFQGLSAQFPGMASAIDHAPGQTFLGCAVVINRAVHPHKDKKDGGCAVMTVVGGFRRGDLIVGSGEYAVRMTYQPGDMVVMASDLLVHGVGPFEGTRRGLVLFSHREVLDWYHDNPVVKLKFPNPTPSPGPRGRRARNH